MLWMWLWFGLAVAFLVLELLTADLVSIWFCAAALITGVVLAIFPALGVGWQFLVFVLLSAAILLATRPLVKRFFRFPRDRSTNLGRLFGRVAVVTERIDNMNGTGAVRIDGLVWTARSLDGDVLEIGEYVLFEKIEGNKALVKRKGE